MIKNRSWLVAIALGLLLFVPAGSVSAWEFTMQGLFTWEYTILSQTGNNGFFGLYDIDRGTNTAGRAASLNAWLGQRAGDMVSGSDAARNTQYMATNMDLRINPALRIRGLYYIGEWYDVLVDSTPGTLGQGNLVASEYLNYRFPGIQRSFSPGYWNTLWLTAQLPWGIVAMGKRPSVFGTGLAWNGEENRSSESLALSADYGPIRIVIGFYPARRAGSFGGADYYNTSFDKNNLRYWDITLPTITYRSGPVDMGLTINYGPRTHRGPERLIDTAANRATSITRDREDFYGGAYIKYNNGRFFFNAEFDWYNRIDRFSGPASQTATNVSPPVYIQSYRTMTEFGVMSGPCKISLLYAWLDGPDRRNGTTLGINQGAHVDAINSSGTNPNPRVHSTSASNTGLFRPYSYLMVYGYGLGAYINLDTGNGYADDASIFAARLDYAVAANLNTYVSFFYADRVGNGYGWGYLSPLNRNNAVTTTGQIFGLYRGSTTPGSAAIRPNIPDNNLGWEIDAGVDWKLLEGFFINTTFAYWQPGRWFNFACIDKGIAGWDTQSTRGAGTYPFGVNPDRSIDPIWGLEIKVNAEF